MIIVTMYGIDKPMRSSIAPAADCRYGRLRRQTIANEKRLIYANALKERFVVLGEFAKDLWHTATIRSVIDDT